MPMLDGYSPAGTSTEPRGLAMEYAAPLNEVDADANYLRVRALTDASNLYRNAQVGKVAQFVAVAARNAGGEPAAMARVCALSTDAVPGAVDVRGSSHTSQRATAARDANARVQGS